MLVDIFFRVKYLYNGSLSSSSPFTSRAFISLLFSPLVCEICLWRKKIEVCLKFRRNNNTFHLSPRMSDIRQIATSRLALALLSLFHSAREANRILMRGMINWGSGGTLYRLVVRERIILTLFLSLVCSNKKVRVIFVTTRLVVFTLYVITSNVL